MHGWGPPEVMGCLILSFGVTMMLEYFSLCFGACIFHLCSKGLCILDIGFGLWNFISHAWCDGVYFVGTK